MVPVILVTTDRRDGGPGSSTPRVRPKRAEAWVSEASIEAVRRAGGLPVLVPPGPSDAATVQQLLAIADGVVLTGGYFDIHPSHYGQAVQARLDRVEPARTALELELARACLHLGKPVLGVCGGHQVLAVAAGGTLVQDIHTRWPTALGHEQSGDPAGPSHRVDVAPCARPIFGAVVQVNSTHHQAVDEPGDLEIGGVAPDGVVEIVVGRGPGFALGVQWHPELLGQSAPFDALLAACAAAPGDGSGAGAP